MNPPADPGGENWAEKHRPCVSGDPIACLGEALEIRRLLPGEEQTVDHVYQLMSAESRLMRFLVAMPPQMPPHLRQLMAEVDDTSHIAFVAMADGCPIGIGRWKRTQASSEQAEVALEVADDWQSRGVGTRLLTHILDSAMSLGVRRLTCLRHPSNRRVLRICKRLGAQGNFIENLIEHQLVLGPGSQTPVGESCSVGTRTIADDLEDL
jgi:RimJ/RimL family protein N-acetyltransferase